MELKTEILKIHKNLNDNLNKEYDKTFVYNEILKLQENIDSLKKPIIYCPDTQKAIKLLNIKSDSYLAVKTNALCFCCLKSKHYTMFDGMQEQKWPTSYFDEKLICKICKN